MTAERHYGLTPRDMEIMVEQGSITIPRRRRSAGRIVRFYKWRAMAFVAMLVVVFLFAALGKIGN